MEKKIGYVLQPLVDEIPLASAIVCKLKQDNPPFLVIPKRYSLDIHELNASGLVPKYSVPLQKTIKQIYSLPGKHFGLSKVEVLLIIFYDSSFLIFNDPSHPLCAYNPTLSDKNGIPNFLVDVYPGKSTQPLILFTDQKCLVKLWDGSNSSLEKVYKMNITKHEIIDLKFLNVGSSPSFAVLVVDDDNNKKLISYSIDLKLINANEIDSYTFDIEDEKAKIIIPLPFGKADHPSFLVCGSVISNCFKSRVVTNDCPFLGNPSCYCMISGWKYIVCDDKGQLILLNVQETTSVTLLGKVDTVPTSITHIDGEYFYITSTCHNSYFIRIQNNNEQTDEQFKITVLNKVANFRPVTCCTEYCEKAGCIYMAQGTGFNNDGSITMIRTGLFFKPDLECDIPLTYSILTVNNYIILNTANNHSIVLEKSKQSEDFSLANPNNFKTDTTTLQVIPCKNNYFVQVLSKEIRLCDVNSNEKIKSFDKEIITCDFYRDNLILLFENELCCYSTQTLELKWNKKIDIVKPKALCMDKGLIILISWNSELQFFNDQGNPINVNYDALTNAINEDSAPSSIFCLKKDLLRICITYSDGEVQLFRINPPLDQSDKSKPTKGYTLELLSSIHIGHLISHSYQISRDSIFINGSSPCVFYSTGHSIPAIVDNDISSLNVVGQNEYIYLLNNNKIVFGSFNESELTEMETIETKETPYLMALFQQDPPSLFCACYSDGKCSLSAYSIPLLSKVFQMELKDDEAENEEINALISYDHNGTPLIICGTTGLTSGRLIVIKEDFGEFHPVSEFVCQNGVFSLAKTKDFLIAGSQCRLFVLKTIISPAGAITIENVSSIPCPVQSRDLVPIQTIGGLIHFDSKRSLTIFRLNNENILEQPPNYIKHVPLITGIVGACVKPREYHLFAADENCYVHQYILKFTDSQSVTSDPETGEIDLSKIDDFEPKLKEVSKIKLSSRVTSMKYVRDGFSIVTTETGDVALLIEMPRDTVKILRSLQNQLCKTLPIANPPENIVNSVTVQLFNHLSIEQQKDISDQIGIPIQTIKNSLKTIHTRTARLCSTLD